ncbi:YhgE/Pip family protein [Nocardia sp. MDA0666]|uniref:YhgE/Pip family protein n=1 Tax=Nocardia sp. MDA0666 TaxID=2135448 RepID=UPI002103B172|nr:YhgE/Pip family protein [Nocardia sp. MDA0666]
MHRAFRRSASPRHRWHHHRPARLCLALIVTLPLAISALYMWFAWDPTNTVDKMPVALVNADQPIQQGSTTVAAGAQVTRSLLDSQALDFHTVDHHAAMEGLGAGKYYFVIEIPSNFSRTLSTLGTASMAPALIKVVYNDNNTVMASNIGSRAMSQIDAAVLKGVAATTVGTVITGLDDLGAGMRSAADGAAQLHTGTNQLASGADELTAGIVNQLAPGMAEATTGSKQLADGAGALATGLQQFRGGTDQLGDGAQQVAKGMDTLIDGFDVAAMQDVVSKVRAQLPQSSTGSAADQLHDGLDQIAAVVDGLRQLQAGSHEVAYQLTDPHADYRSGLDQLVNGGKDLATGATALSTGMQQLDSGVRSVSDGVQQLQQGTHSVDDGADQLAAGLHDGVQQLPDFGTKERQSSLAELLGTPVAEDTHNIASAQFGGPGGAPMLLTIGSALIAIVVVMCFRSHRFTPPGNRGPAARLLRRMLATSTVGLLGVAALTGLVWTGLSSVPTVSSVSGLAATLIAATVMNVAVVSLLFAVGGYVAGSLASLTVFMFEVFCYGGIWMVETLPAPMRWLHAVDPMTYVRQAMMAVFNGASGFPTAMIGIVAITVTVLVATVIVHRTGQTLARRRVSVPADPESGSFAG